MIVVKHEQTWLNLNISTLISLRTFTRYKTWSASDYKYSVQAAPCLQSRCSHCWLNISPATATERWVCFPSHVKAIKVRYWHTWDSIMITIHYSCTVLCESLALVLCFFFNDFLTTEAVWECWVYLVEWRNTNTQSSGIIYYLPLLWTPNIFL